MEIKSTTIFDWAKIIHEQDKFFIPTTDFIKVGLKYIINVEDHYFFSIGNIVTLHRDDGTSCPEFKGEKGTAYVNWCKLIPYKWRQQ